MHPSPTYARLQIVSRIRAEVCQRLRAVTPLTSGLSADLTERLAAVANRLEWAARDVENVCLSRHDPQLDARLLERQVRQELSWLTDSVDRLCDAARNGRLTAELCDELTETIDRKKERRETIA